MGFLNWLFGAAWGAITAPFVSIVGKVLDSRNSTQNTQATIVASDNAARATIVSGMLAHWLTQIPIFCLMMLPAAYGWVVWYDVVFHTHSTDAIHGDVSSWMNTIIVGTFGYGSVVVGAMTAKSLFGK